MNGFEGQKKKSFWDKPEGSAGMIFTGVALLGGGYLLYRYLPLIINILENTLYAGCLFAIVGFLIFLVMNERTRTLMSYMFQGAMRKITSVFVAVDPIGILKTYIKDLRDSMSDMEKQIQNLRGQMKILHNTIEKNEKCKLSALRKAQSIQGKNQSEFLVQSRQAGRLQKSNVSLIELYKKMELLYKVLSKMRETSEVLLRDMQNEVDIQVQQYQMSKTAYSVLGQAMKIIKGEGAGRELYDEAMDRMEQEYGQKMGEIEHFMEISKSFIDGVDLQNQAYEEKAMQMLQEWEQKGGTLLGEDKQLLLNNIQTNSLDFSNLSELEPIHLEEIYDK